MYIYIYIYKDSCFIYIDSLSRGRDRVPRRKKERTDGMEEERNYEIGGGGGLSTHPAGGSEIGDKCEDECW